jgi:hypothetical protein
MIARVFRTVILFAATACLSVASPPESKDSRAERLLGIVNRVHAIGKSGYSDAKWQIIQKEIDAVPAVEDLRSLILIFYGVLSPQKGDESYDFAFEAGIRACIRKLATIPTEQASSALKSLQSPIGFDSSLGLQEAIQEQAKIVKPRSP